MDKELLNKRLRPALLWSVVAVLVVALATIGVFLANQFDGAIETSARLARPHAVQSSLAQTRATLDYLQDAVQDYLIDGADGMRYQYEDAMRVLGNRMAELGAFKSDDLAPQDVAAISALIAEVRNTSRLVIDARHAGKQDGLRRLADANSTAVAAAQRRIDEFIAAQQDLLNTRDGSLRQRVAQMYGGLVAATAIILCFIIGAVALLEYDRRRSVAIEAVLLSDNERLENAVRERSESLARTNRELMWFSRRALQIQEHERGSLALELHDQIGQGLASLVVAIGRCERQIPPDTEGDVQNVLRECLEIARAAYGDVNDLSLNLRPAMLDRLGLVPTLQWYARQQSKVAGLEVVVKADALPARLPPDVLTAAFRIVQESVSNAVRHANARRVEIRLQSHDGQIELRIKDDGVGFDVKSNEAENKPRFGLGLIGMRQRALDMGGQVLINSKPGSGTEIVARLTVPDEE